MKELSTEWWARAIRARAKLEAQVWSLPEVSMIDIGRDPDRVNDLPVLRVHVRNRSRSLPGLPAEVEGIAVRVIYGNYEPQKELT